MHSSYNIVKSAVIDESKVILPPKIEEVLEKRKQLEVKINEDNENIKNKENINEIKNTSSKLVEDAKAKAHNILTNAEIKSKEIINKAQNDAEKIKKEANGNGYQEGYKKGYSEGYEHGINEAEEKATEIRNEADEYIKGVQNEINLYIKDNKENIIKLAVKIAEHILNTELTLNNEAIYKIAEKVVASATDKKQVILKVNPSDFNIVKNRKQELSIYVEDVNNIIVVADPTVNKGSVKAETPSGFIDGDINEQLDIIFRKLVDENGSD